MKKILFVLLFLSIGYPLISMANGMEGENQIDMRLPNFKAEEVSGRKIDLELLLKDGKMVLVNFWGLRCGACIQEIPKLNDLYRKYSDRVVFLGVNVDGADNNLLRTQMEKSNVVIDYLVVPDPQFMLADLFKLHAAPFTVIIDQDGAIKFQHENYEEGDEKKIEEALRNCLSVAKPITN